MEQDDGFQGVLTFRQTKWTKLGQVDILTLWVDEEPGLLHPIDAAPFFNIRMMADDLFSRSDD